MPLDPKWTEMIFAKLAITYGTRFFSGYAGQQPELVKRHWAHELEGISHAALTHALQNLPPDHPPNVLQFRALCARRPEGNPMLGLPRPQANPEAVARVKAKLAVLLQGPRSQRSNLTANAEMLRDREMRGEPLNTLQREFWRKALRVTDEGGEE